MAQDNLKYERWEQFSLVELCDLANLIGDAVDQDRGYGTEPLKKIKREINDSLIRLRKA